ncbi:Transcriptional regulator, TetR family [Corynebacterium ciconiae DSM 44920]|uniref:TetR/AcrR family transcriptional regulator n=1 Tax=Corynebacterium ciconiae TaxID=227319 RepID=UPI00037EDDBA|nr:helix-turn-helix domain-containing protein [Corynebacterium ciconiae]WKD61905.1 Transcriptional regulator, TetR family [Corynebacterium ciconiae DSM 44920]
MRADAQANRDAIVTAAQTLFQEEGIDVSFRRIATESRVGVATVHRNFPDRRVLVTAVTERVTAQAHDIVRAHEHSWDEDPWQNWNDVIIELVRLGITPLAEQISRFAYDENLLAEIVEQRRAAITEVFAGVLKKARRHRFIPADVTPIRFAMGIGMISRELPAVGRQLIDDQQEWFARVYLEGLRSLAQ